MLTTVRLAAAYFAILLFAACAGATPRENGPPNAEDFGVATASPASVAEPSAAPGMAPGGVGTLLDAAKLTSLRGLVELHPYILVGQVQAGAELFYYDPYPEGSPCPVPFTIYSVAVERVIAAPEGNLTAVVPVVLNTGPEKEGCYVVDGGQEKPLQPGRRYLFFLEDRRPAGGRGFNGFGFARFEITPGGTIRPTGGERDFPGVAAVSGVTPDEMQAVLASPDPQAALDALARVTVDEAAAKIQAAIAEGPLPARGPSAQTPGSSPSEPP